MPCSLSVLQVSTRNTKQISHPPSVIRPTTEETAAPASADAALKNNFCYGNYMYYYSYYFSN